ncbi:MAG TPA: hypothetical protein VM487_09455 [Phycisphaerae bacterium]|nr:hypothetical protein [Phycisphaerae bacterium]
MNAFRISTIVLGLAAFSVIPASAQCEFDRLVSGWGSTWGLFGNSVAIEGNTAVIGASGEDSNGDYKGAVYVFEYTDQWTQVARLTASDRAQNDSFGGAVAISGDWILAGATGDNSYQGAAYFFKKPDNGWTDMTETQKVTAPDGSPGDFFGRDVDIDGEVAAIGADQHGDPWEMMGAVYVYRYDGSSWGSVKKLLANDSDNDYAQDHFGFSVALSGDTLVVGAPSDDYGSYDRCGAAYIFCYEFDGDYWTWVQKAKLRAQWPGSNDSLGHDVDIDGDTVLVGAPDDGASGAAHIFEKPPNGWTDMNETQRLSVLGDGNAERLGMSVAIDGDTLIVGDNYAEDFGTLGGAAHTFQYDGSSWGGHVKVLASDGSQGQEFGNSVALDGDTVVIGAYGDNWNGTYTGAAYIFAMEGDDCNFNGICDFRDIADGFSPDCNGNGTPDECDIANGDSQDANGNGIPDECEGGLGDSDTDGPVAPTFARPVPGWRESFDAYENGSGMHGQNDWQGWDNDPAFDAFVTDAQAHSAPHSADIAQASDLVHQYDGYTSGQWRFTAWQYIPADFTCDNDTPFEPGTYFLLLNTYNDGGPYNWSVQFVFDSNDGMLKVSYGDGHSTIDLPYVTDQWVKIHAEIDLDNDLTRVYYDGELIAEYSWTGGIYGEGDGALDIGAVDLFANGSSSVYYDDLSLRPVRSRQ